MTKSAAIVRQNQVKKEAAMLSRMRRSETTIAGCMLVLAGCTGMQSPQSQQSQQSSGAGNMTFFVTSAGPGKGADLGGLEGADQHCQTLAKAAGAGNRTWRAYLSTQGSALNDPKFVNARDRIGTGPWQNVKGVVIARTSKSCTRLRTTLPSRRHWTRKGNP
jgi:hypothetical protein